MVLGKLAVHMQEAETRLLFLTLWIKDLNVARHWWHTPAIPATQESEIRELQLEASLGKQFMRPILKNPSQKKGLVE
jgi:hypothetical protein